MRCFSGPRATAAAGALLALCALASPAALSPPPETPEAAGLEPRLVGQCTIDGPCERFPDMGGRRDDNQQGYLLHGAGIGAALCALRARDHHMWCGNHPDAPVHAFFEREKRREPEHPADRDVGHGSFPYVLANAHADAQVEQSDEAGPLHRCVESYQIARGSTWSESLCPPAPGFGAAGCAPDERHTAIRLQALSDVSALVCVRRQPAERAGHMPAQYKLYIGEVAPQGTGEPSLDPGSLCSLAASRGIFWRRPFDSQQDKESHGSGEHAACALPFETARHDFRWAGTHTPAEGAAAQLCCLHDAEEHLYSPPVASASSNALMRWRPCLYLCSESAASALVQTTGTAREDPSAPPSDAPRARPSPHGQIPPPARRWVVD